MEHEFYSFNINDCVFGCNSYTMDMLANLYFFRQYQIHDKVERDYNPNISYKCIKAKAETEIYMGQKSIKKIILD